MTYGPLRAEGCLIRHSSVAYTHNILITCDGIEGECYQMGRFDDSPFDDGITKLKSLVVNGRFDNENCETV